VIGPGDLEEEAEPSTLHRIEVVTASRLDAAITAVLARVMLDEMVRERQHREAAYSFEI